MQITTTETIPNCFVRYSQIFYSVTLRLGLLTWIGDRVTVTSAFSRQPGQLVTMEFYTVLHFFLTVQCCFFSLLVAELRPRKIKRLSSTGVCRIWTRAVSLLPDLCKTNTQTMVPNLPHNRRSKALWLSRPKKGFKNLSHPDS